MVGAVDELTDLRAFLFEGDHSHDEQLTFTMVRSQFGSIRFCMSIKASGTIQSFTGGGLG